MRLPGDPTVWTKTWHGAAYHGLLGCYADDACLCDPSHQCHWRRGRSMYSKRRSRWFNRLSGVLSMLCMQFPVRTQKIHCSDPREFFANSKLHRFLGPRVVLSSPDRAQYPVKIPVCREWLRRPVRSSLPPQPASPASEIVPVEDAEHPSRCGLFSSYHSLRRRSFGLNPHLEGNVSRFLSGNSHFERLDCGDWVRSSTITTLPNL